MSDGRPQYDERYIHIGTTPSVTHILRQDGTSELSEKRFECDCRDGFATRMHSQYGAGGPPRVFMVKRDKISMCR